MRRLKIIIWMLWKALYPAFSRGDLTISGGNFLFGGSGAAYVSPSGLISANSFASGSGGGLSANSLTFYWRSAGQVAAASPLLLNGSVYEITGAGTIASFTGTAAPGQILILKFSAAATVENSATIKLRGGVNFSATDMDMLTLIYDGSYWYEIMRSVN